MKNPREYLIHAVLTGVALLMMLPFLFVINNSFRTNTEMYYSFFGLPKAFSHMLALTWSVTTGLSDPIILEEAEGEESRISKKPVSYAEAMGALWQRLTSGYGYCWSVFRPYMVNSLFVSGVTALGVVLLGSISGYVFSRYRFPGCRILFVFVLSLMMIPPVLTLVPGFLLVKKLGLLNSYWVLILPYTAGGQILAIFLFKGFFDSLPEELFESARLDGAGHLALYLHIVLPLSGQIVAVVMIINILSTWNNFLWPFVTNTDSSYHVVASGLFVMGQSEVAQNLSAMFAGYILSSIPLMILFIYGTKPFMRGVTAGAFKA